MSKAQIRALMLASLRSGAAILPLTIAAAQMPAYGQVKTQAQLDAEAAAASAAAAAEDAASADDAAAAAASGAVIEKDIVVTGTSIRGIAPTGTNSVTVTREQIQATGATSASQLLATIPQIGGNFFNQIPQADQINSLAAGIAARNDNRPQLRPSAGGQDTGSSTLILLNGNRTAGVGVNSNAPSPDSVPAALLERVELATDGASAVYGSDAIGGVINYVTRRKYDGLEVSGRYGFASHYKTYDGTVIGGRDWGSGSAFASYSYAFADRIFNRDRSYVNPIDFLTGLQRDLNCDNANIRLNASGSQPLRYYATTPTSVASSFFTVVAPVVGTPNVCQANRDATLASGSKRHSALGSFAQDLADGLEFTLRARYSQNETIYNQNPQPFTQTITNSNPYWRPLTGTPDATATSYSVLGNWGPALGRDPFTYGSKEKAWGLNGQLDWDVNEDWQIRFTGIYDASKSFYANPSLTASALTNGFQTPSSTVPAPACLTASNSLAAAGGNTAANAGNAAAVAARDAARRVCFNPFDPAASDPALLAGLLTSEVVGRGHDQIWNFKAVADGTLFKIPGGDVRIGVGVEYLRDHFGKGIFSGLKADRDKTLVLPEVTQTNKSVFAEINVPLVSSANGMPFLRELRLSASGRYDHYTVYGGTFNPRFGANYKPADWLRIRGNFNKSFRAPTTVDLLGFGVSNTTVSAFMASQATPSGQLFVNPALPLDPPGNTNPARIGSSARALVLTGTNPDLGPQKGKGWSVGIELTPIQGLFASATYYRNEYTGAFGNPGQTSTFYPLYTAYVLGLFPITEQQKAAFIAQGVPAAGTLDPRIYSADMIYGLFDTRKTNLGDRNIAGLDYQVRYTKTVGFGTIFASANGNIQLLNENRLVSTLPFSDVLAGSLHRMTLQGGMTSGGFRFTATLNHSAGYDIVPSATTFQEHVDSYQVVNLFASYNFQNGGIMKDLQISLSINNAFKNDPPVLRRNGGTGYDNGQTLGRVFQFGISKKFF